MELYGTRVKLSIAVGIKEIITGMNPKASRNFGMEKNSAARCR